MVNYIAKLNLRIAYLKLFLILYINSFQSEQVSWKLFKILLLKKRKQTGLFPFQNSIKNSLRLDKKMFAIKAYYRWEPKTRIINNKINIIAFVSKRQTNASQFYYNLLKFF